MVGGLLTAILFKLLLSREGGVGGDERQKSERKIYPRLFI